MVTISTRVKRHDAGARDRRALSRRLLLGRHASAQRARRSPISAFATIVAHRAASQGRRDRRSRARLSLRSQPARRAGQASARHIAAARETRLAARDPLPRGRRRHGAHSRGRNAGRAPSPPFSIVSPAAAIWPCAASTLGGYVSFSGILTFKNSEELRAIAADLPVDRLLVETDAPYLAPAVSRQAQRAGFCRGDRRRCWRECAA